MAGGMVALRADNFDDYLSSAKVPVVVNFWASGSGPCKMLSAVLVEVADEHAGQLTLAKLNVDDYPEIAARFEVTSVPTLVVFRDRVAVTRMIGARPKATLLHDLEAVLGAPKASGVVEGQGVAVVGEALGGNLS